MATKTVCDVCGEAFNCESVENLFRKHGAFEIPQRYIMASDLLKDGNNVVLCISVRSNKRYQDSEQRMLIDCCDKCLLRMVNCPDAPNKIIYEKGDTK